MLERLEILQANKKKFANGSELFFACKSDYQLQNEINQLSNYFLNRDVQGCSSCQMDAYLELININTKNVMEKPNYQLKAGAILFDVNGDEKSFCTNINLTDELAIYHLRTNPACEDLFQKKPHDWKNQVEESKKNKKVQNEEPKKN